MAVMRGILSADCDVVIKASGEIMVAGGCCYAAVAAFDIDGRGGVKADDLCVRAEGGGIARRCCTGGDCVRSAWLQA